MEPLLYLAFLLVRLSLGLAVPLRFNHNTGQFKILQVADMHYANGANTTCLNVLPTQISTCSDLNTTAFINRLIHAEEPDLIVFTGDNIFGADCDNSEASQVAAFSPAVNAQIPWAAVLGNHDQEGNLNRSQLMQHIVSMNYSLGQINPPANKLCMSSERQYHDCSTSISIDGYGNYILEVAGPQRSELTNKSLLNLYFLDSGDYSTIPGIDGYGWIKPSQQVWFSETSAQLQAVYRSSPPAQNVSAPGLVYFHIPLPEFNKFSTSNMTGVKQEGISSAELNSGFFETIKKAGDVKAVFVGHDHVNDFCGKLSDVNLCYAGGIGYHAYGLEGWSRRARVVIASLGKDDQEGWADVQEIATWKRLDDDGLTTLNFEVLWNLSMEEELANFKENISFQG